jgi:predicted small lipoprotein YifL
MTRRFLALSGLLLALAACGKERPVSLPPTPPRPVVTTPPPTVPEPVFVPPRDAKILNLPGLEGVIGAPASSLVTQFGQPRLDVREGDARKLQFAGEACVLDIFIYPIEGMREPIATYLDARRASDGQDVDRAACVAALKRP